MGAVTFPYPTLAYYPPALNETFFRNAGVLQVAAQPTATPCVGDTITLLAYGAGATNLQWAPGPHLPAGASGPRVQVLADSVATYQVSGLSGDAPPRALSAQFTVRPQPRPAPPVVTFSGGVLTAQAGGPVGSWQWLLNGQELTGATGSTLVPVQSGSYSVVLTGPGGCPATSMAVAVVVNGVGEEAAAGARGLTVWPVPADAVVWVRGAGQGGRLLDVLGREVARSTGTGAEQVLAVGALPAGVYWFQTGEPVTCRAKVLVRH